MSEWFHADGDRQVGPLTVEAMGARFRAQQIDLDTLVWRDGLSGWQPLRTVAHELGLGSALRAETEAPPVPDVPDVPPIPAPAPEVPAATPAPAVATVAVPAAAPAAPLPPPAAPRQGLSKGAIIAIVLGGAAVVIIPIVAMLAAIALPAYQEYTVRARIAGAVTALAPLQEQVAAFSDSEGLCPTNDDAGFPDSGDFQSAGLSKVQFGRFNNGNCGIEATLSVGQPALEDDLLWLEYDTDQHTWTCSGQSDDAKLPAHCRG